MSYELKIDKDAIRSGEGMLKVVAADLKHVEEGDEVAIVKALGYNGIFTTRDLMFAPMTLAIFEMMGQNGIKNLMFRGGSYAGERFALETIEAGMAKWDDSLLQYHKNIFIATGWGYIEYPEIDLNPEGLEVVCLIKNHPCATTVVEIMESAVQENPSLKIDHNQTFCDYHTGWLQGKIRLLMKNIGVKEELISRIKGVEEYCQAQEGRDHCRHVVRIFD